MIHHLADEAFIQANNKENIHFYSPLHLPRINEKLMLNFHIFFSVYFFKVLAELIDNSLE